MIVLPETQERYLIIRTDFTDNSKWEIICDAIRNPENEFESYVVYIDDPKFDNLDIFQLPKFPIEQQFQTFVLLID